MLLLIVVPSQLLAQEALTQTYTSSDGMLTISFPEGWTVEEDDGLIRFSSDQGFIQINYYDYGEQVTPQEILEIGAAEYLGFSPAKQLIVGGYAALQAAGEDQLHTVINFCGGMFGLVIAFVQPGQVEAITPTVNAMLDTIRFGDGEPEDCRGAFEGLTPITPANAAQAAQLARYGDAAVPVESVTFNPDGDMLAAGDLNGSAWLWSMVTGKELWELPRHTGGATSVAFASGGYQLVVGAGNGRVWMWDATFGTPNGRIQEHSDLVASIAVSPDGFLIASGSTDGSVRLYDMLQGRERPMLIAENPIPVTGVAFSPDGTTLAAGGGSTIRLLDVEAGTVKAELETEISDIASIAFSPDGTALVYGGADPAAWVWNLAGDNHALLEGHDQRVSALAFSPDGQMIVSGDASAVHLWNAATGERLATLTNASVQAVNSVTFSPNGTLVASGGDAGGVVLWGTSEGGGAEQETAASTSTDTGEAAETTTTEETTNPASHCTITAPGNANLRGGPGTNFERAGTLSAGQSAEVNGQAQGGDGMTWYRLTDGTWVRSDVVGSPAECEGVAFVTP